MNITKTEIEKLENCKTKEDWQSTVKDIKKTRKGFPPDWYKEVVATGLMGSIVSKFDS